MGEIIYYTLKGTVDSKSPLTVKHLDGINGKMIRCHRIDGTYLDGYGIFDNKHQDIVCLWKWKHLDEQTGLLTVDDDSKFDRIYSSIAINQIQDIEVILFSNPRWGGRLKNKFFIQTDFEKKGNKS